MYGTPEEISEAHKPSAGEHYVLADKRVSPRPRVRRPGSLLHAELENGVSVGRSRTEVKKPLELGLSTDYAPAGGVSAAVSVLGAG